MLIKTHLTSLQRNRMNVLVILFRLAASSTAYRKYTEPPIIPGRPIVGGPNCPTNKLSDGLNFETTCLQSKKLCERFVSFFRNASKKSTFMTFDITNLYRNISQGLGLEAISYWIGKYPEDLTEYRFRKEFVIRGLELILTLNYFVFDGKWYLQIKECAMGTEVAIVSAILTVGYLEIKLYTILPDYFSEDSLSTL